MAKLTVYLPDELADRVREARLSTSPIAQQAFEAALAGPRISMTRLGWCRVAGDGSETMVRFALSADRIVVVEHVTAGYDIPNLRAVEGWANGPGAEALREAMADRAATEPAEVAAVDAEERAVPALRAGWGLGDDAIADLRVVTGA